MAILMVCLVSYGVSGMRWSYWIGGGFSGVSISLRYSVFVWLLDVCVLSYVCLEVNHAESLYWLLVASTLGLWCSEISVSASAFMVLGSSYLLVLSVCVSLLCVLVGGVGSLLVTLVLVLWY